MQAITFDTLAFSEQLKAFGVPEEQARGHAQALSTVLKQVEETLKQTEKMRLQVEEARLEDVATKRDIKELAREMATKLEIEKIRGEIAETKADIIKWVAGIMLAQTGLLFTLLKLFPH
ncbi:MAG: hypothetical protein H7833_18500 [Magnetococcus sp. DMHC-1]